MTHPQPTHLPSTIQAQLTQRQVEVARLILKGYDDRQIGQRLCITRDTIQSHKKNIRLRLVLPPRVPIIRALFDLIAEEAPKK